MHIKNKKKQCRLLYFRGCVPACV